MRRLVLVLLIALLPLQAIWAAAANACGHEHTAHQAHFGHHQHAEPDANRVAGDDEGKPAIGEVACGGDCSTCHGHGWSAAAMLEPPPTRVQSLPEAWHSAYQRFSLQRFPDNLLRPPLARLA